MAIQIIINDSSCLIDLRKGGLLTTALLLPFQFVVAFPLVKDELNDFTSADWEDLQARGLKVIDLDGSQVQRAFVLKRLYPGLSPHDCFSLALAEAYKGAMLLTGDQQLRRKAESIGLQVHGLLWISDQIEECGKMPSSTLLKCLERLSSDPLVFLPLQEIKQRIERLRKRG